MSTAILLAFALSKNQNVLTRKGIEKLAAEIGNHFALFHLSLSQQD
jgi:hypothetical protein